MEGKVVSSMALLRVISGFIEITAAIVILRLHKVESALRINALLGIVGPIVFILVSALGLIAITVKFSPCKIGLIALGIVLVLLGTKG